MAITNNASFVEQANQFREEGDHIQAKKYGRRSLFCTSLAINLFTVAVILFIIGLGFAIDYAVRTIRNAVCEGFNCPSVVPFTI